MLQIEQRIRLELSCIAQAMVVGEGQDYLAVLLTLQTKRCEKSGKRTKELTENAKRWFRFARWVWWIKKLWTIVFYPNLHSLEFYVTFWHINFDKMMYILMWTYIIRIKYELILRLSIQIVLCTTMNTALVKHLPKLLKVKKSEIIIYSLVMFLRSLNMIWYISRN